MSASTTHLGSGLAITTADQPIRPTVVRHGFRRFRAEVQGVVAGRLVRQWAAPDFRPTQAEAMADLAGAPSPGDPGRPNGEKS